MIAGTMPVKVKGIDFGWFGDMRAAGRFQGYINDNDQQLSEALDCIPSTKGSISKKEHFDPYINGAPGRMRGLRRHPTPGDEGNPIHSFASVAGTTKDCVTPSR